MDNFIKILLVPVLHPRGLDRDYYGWANWVDTKGAERKDCERRTQPLGNRLAPVDPTVCWLQQNRIDGLAVLERQTNLKASKHPKGARRKYDLQYISLLQYFL
jgi:hypothetical protein